MNQANEERNMKPHHLKHEMPESVIFAISAVQSSGGSVTDEAIHLMLRKHAGELTTQQIVDITISKAKKKQAEADKGK